MLEADSVKDLRLIIESQIPIITIESHEEEQVLTLVRRLSNVLGRPAFSWTVTEGLVHQDDQMMAVEKPAHDQPEMVLKEIRQRKRTGIYVLIDFDPYLKDAPRIERLLKEVALGYERFEQSIVLLSGKIDIPDSLKPFCAHFEMPVPDRKTLSQMIIDEGKHYARNHRQKFKIDPAAVEKLIVNLSGLALSDAKRLSRKAIYDDGVISNSDIEEVNKAKYELLDMDGLLQFEYETARFADVGDLKNLKEWLNSRKLAFLNNIYTSSADVPKGIMLVGIQGGGKSLAAKAVAGAWGLPLLRLDFAVLYNKYFGETERNIRKALKMAETMAPCVLWMDEVEKGLAAGDYDSGTSRRVLGTFLTWMSERKKPVFIVATSNDIESLPPELIRKGRLDEIFFVDLPDSGAREDIFRIHLLKRGLSPEHFDISQLAEQTSGFTGAEIEQSIVSVLYRSRALKKNGASSEGPGFSTQHILEEIKKTKPLSVVMAEKINALRHWADGRTVRAN